MSTLHIPAKKGDINDVTLAMTASTDANINNRFTNILDFVPHADFKLLLAAYEAPKNNPTERINNDNS